MLSVLTLSLGCTDTLGWKNQWGDSCWTYTQRCRDGQFFAESWTQGKDYNFPEKNCCACGKDSVVETRQPASPYPGASAGGCQDHPNYVNQYGLDCAGYVRSGYCANGNVVQGQEWAMGADYGYPEKACCACGRDRPQCVDNDKWHNRYKGTCAKYVSEGHCCDGKACAGREWTLGPDYDYPERECCACGKQAGGGGGGGGGGGQPQQQQPRVGGGQAQWQVGWPGQQQQQQPQQQQWQPTPPTPACKDTTNWKNRHGATCDDYRTDGHCMNGGFAPGHEWTAGPDMDSPEIHCCGCGRFGSG